MTTSPTALRDAGMRAAEDNADPRVMLTVDAVIGEAVDSGIPFSANDIRDRLPMTSRGLVGARVRAWSQQRPQVMWPVDRVASNLPSTHGKEIIVWAGRRWFESGEQVAS